MRAAGGARLAAEARAVPLDGREPPAELELEGGRPSRWPSRRASRPSPAREKISLPLPLRADAAELAVGGGGCISWLDTCR